jgi:hypothetical protein
MEAWYDSVKELGLSAVVFHDGLSDAFVRTYATDKACHVCNACLN